MHIPSFHYSVLIVGKMMIQSKLIIPSNFELLGHLWSSVRQSKRAL